MKRDTSTSRAPNRVERRLDPQELLAAEIHINAREHDSASLARAMGVSIATVGRLLATLRRRLARRGGDLVSVKRGARSHYEIRDDTARSRRWAQLRDLIGVVDGKPREAGESIDDVLYGPSKP